MQLFAFGINHQTAPLAVREQVAFHAEGLPQALRDLVDQRAGARSGDPLHLQPHRGLLQHAGAAARRSRWLASYHQLKTRSSSPISTRCRSEQAVKHAFRVASGLDSMVLGEPQILGQMKEAVRTAEAGRHAGTGAAQAVPAHLLGGQGGAQPDRDRRQHRCPWPPPRCRLAERIYPSIREQKVLFIGAGEMIELCADALRRAASARA